MSTRDDALGAIDDALIRLRRLWAASHRRADLERDIGEGIRLSQVLVVDAVVRVGSTQEVTVGAVADQLSVYESTASRLVDGTVRAGLLDRVGSSQDARRVVLLLTDGGRQLFDRALEYRLAYLAGLLDEWSPEDRADLARLLGRFADAVNPST